MSQKNKKNIKFDSDYYEEKYEWFWELLQNFMTDSYYSELKDIDTINRFINKMSNNVIKGAIKEGKEILQLEPFPHKWIGSLMNAGWKTDNDCKQWINWMIEALETEGKRVGKL